MDSAQKEAMRAARLARLGGSPPASVSAAASQPMEVEVPPVMPPVVSAGDLITTSQGLTILKGILYEGGGASLEDMERWYG